MMTRSRQGLNFNAPYQPGARGSRRVSVTINMPYGRKDGDIVYRAVKVVAWRRDGTQESYEDEAIAELNFDSVYSIVWSEAWQNLMRNHAAFAFTDEYGVKAAIKYVRNMGHARPFIEVYVSRDLSPALDLPEITELLAVDGKVLTLDGKPLAL